MGGPDMAPQVVQARGYAPSDSPAQRSPRRGGAVARLDER
jgi:hypothetical protein